MKRIYYFILFISLVMFTACESHVDPEQRATDLISLADSLIGLDENAARTALEKAGYEEDVTTDLLFIRESKQLGYIRITLDEDAVSCVEAGQDHTTPLEARQTAKLWSKRAYNSFPEVTYYRGEIITLEGDTTRYRNGEDNDHSAYLLDLIDYAETIDYSAEQMYYGDVDIDFDSLPSLDDIINGNFAWDDIFNGNTSWDDILNGNSSIGDILNNSYVFESASIETYEKHWRGDIYYRTVYVHDSKATLSVKDLLNF